MIGTLRLSGRRSARNWRPAFSGSCRAPRRRRRATILCVLTQASFVPDSRTHVAIAISFGRTPTPDSELGAELVRLARDPLRTRIEEFAATYFALRPDNRSERWRELWRQSKGTVGAHQRLRDLAPGLKLDRSTVRDPSPEVQQLAELCLALFVLPPGAQTCRRRAELARVRAGDDVSYAAWQRTVRRLRRRYRAIAAHVPELLEDL